MEDGKEVEGVSSSPQRAGRAIFWQQSQFPIACGAVERYFQDTVAKTALRRILFFDFEGEKSHTSRAALGSLFVHSKPNSRRQTSWLRVMDYLRARTSSEQAALWMLFGVTIVLFLYAAIEDHDSLFILAETVHFSGIGTLAFKLIGERDCTCLSLKTQELTAIFLAVRLYCSFAMEYDIHTFLDLLTLAATIWVIYTMRITLRKTYNEQMDDFHTVYILAPCVLAAVLVHPTTSHAYINRIFWAVCVYIEAVSVLPQLRMMQKAKTVERFTANYVFALGVARFLSCAHWVMQVFDAQSYLTTAVGSGLWPVMVLLSEIVQTFILADFCYYYILSFAKGSRVVRLPAGIV